MVTVLAGEVEGVKDDGKGVYTVQIWMPRKAERMALDSTFPINAKVGDEIVLSVQVNTPVPIVVPKGKRKIDPNLEKGRPSVPGPAK